MRCAARALARELVRAVQDARKQAGLEVADRIVLLVEGDAAVTAALAEHRDYLMSETLASAWRKPGAGEFVAAQEQGEARWVIRLARESGGAMTERRWFGLQRRRVELALARRRRHGARPVDEVRWSSSDSRNSIESCCCPCSS